MKHRPPRDDTTLWDDICAAWKDAVLPPEDEVLHDPACQREECAALRRVLAGRPWGQLDPAAWWRGPGGDGYVLLRGPAFRYYLPALLGFALRRPSRWLGHVVQALTPAEGWQERGRGYTPAQAAVLLRFLRWAQASPAALVYWEARSAGLLQAAQETLNAGALRPAEGQAEVDPL